MNTNTSKLWNDIAECQSEVISGGSKVEMTKFGKVRERHCLATKVKSSEIFKVYIVCRISNTNML